METNEMALILVCGSALADSPSVKKGLNSLARIAKTPITAIALVSFVSAVACWINWGFGLIVGVVFAKSIARNLKGVDYRLLIASAYSGFLLLPHGREEYRIRLLLVLVLQLFLRCQKGFLIPALSYCLGLRLQNFQAGCFPA